jgi:Flp pilus assembly protein TadG
MKHLIFSRMGSRQKGAAVIEFAITLPLLILIFTGMIEFGRLMWNYNALAKATRDAARYLVDEPAPITTAMTVTAQNMVGDAAAAAGVDGLVPASDVAIVCNPSDCANPDTISVNVRYTFTIGGWVPIINPRSGGTITDVTLSPHTTMPYMR